MLRRWSSRELGELQAFDRLDPFGSWREDLRSATICYVLARVLGGADDSITVETFLPEFDPDPKPARPKSADDLVAVARMVNAVNNAHWKRNHGDDRGPGGQPDGES